MVSEKPSRVMVKMFKQAGWTALRTVGSHTMWGCPCARKHRFSLTDGHRTISAGVVSGALKALTECEKAQQEDAESEGQG